jgi:hypothetical protein
MDKAWLVTVSRYVAYNPDLLGFYKPPFILD